MECDQNHRPITAAQMDCFKTITRTTRQPRRLGFLIVLSVIATYAHVALARQTRHASPLDTNDSFAITHSGYVGGIAENINGPGTHMDFSPNTGTTSNNEGLALNKQEYWLNEPPVANAGGPYLVVVGEQITLDASASLDPDGDTLIEFWTADGGYVAGNIYTAGATPGVYRASVIVNDGKIDSAPAITMVVVCDPTMPLQIVRLD